MVVVLMPCACSSSVRKEKATGGRRSWSGPSWCVLGCWRRKAGAILGRKAIFQKPGFWQLTKDKREGEEGKESKEKGEDLQK